MSLRSFGSSEVLVDYFPLLTGSENTITVLIQAVYCVVCSLYFALVHSLECASDFVFVRGLVFKRLFGEKKI